MKPIFNKCSAFNTIINNQQDDKISFLAYKKAEQIIETNQIVQIKESKSQGEQPSPLISLLLSIFISLIKDSSKQEISQKISTSIFSNILSNHIKIPLLRLIASIIQKKLYKKDGVDNEITYSVIFKNFMVSFFLSIVSQNSNLIGMQKVVNLHRTLLADNYMLYIPIYLYFLYGGSLFTIEKKIFKNQFQKLITNLSMVLSKQENILTRNFDRIKKNKYQNQILTQSLNIVCSATNKQYLEEITQKLCTLIFGDKDYIKKEQFCLAIANLPEQEQSKQYLFFFMNLLRVELQISIQHKNSLDHFETSEKDNTSFYTSQMQKILKKCPYNGDLKCDCKKCQCVRRNRQSAKISQEKKRNAVQQIEPMKQKIFSLEIRNKQLEQENMILKGLLNTLKSNPELKSILMNTIEPVSKILKDN